MAAVNNVAVTRLLTACLLALSLACRAGGAATGRLLIDSDGDEVRIALDGPALALVGFDHAPRDAGERETLAAARDNLQAGEAMIRLPFEAGCRLVGTEVDTDPAPGNGEAEGRLGARYRFDCSRHQALDSVAVGVFAGFPFLARIHASYHLGPVQGEAILTPLDPVVVLVPLQ